MPKHDSELPRDTSSKPMVLQLAEKVPDPRSDKFKKHPLPSMIFIALVGCLCGADDWVAIADTGAHLEDWIRQYVPLPNGIPSHDTFGRTFGLIKTEAFNQLLIQWADHLRSKVGKEVVALDGKALKGSADKQAGLSGLHLLNAWSVDNGLCLGQLKVDKKTNESKVVPELIQLLELEGCVITADALNTQKSTADAVIEAKADYVLPVKGNHPGLLEDIQLLFQDAEAKEYRGFDADQYETTETGHGRWEQRIYSILDAEELPAASEWRGMLSVGKVVRRRTHGCKSTIETCYFIASLETEAKLFAKAVRGHWGVENELHWSLDVTFREDDNRYLDHAGAENMSAVRKLSLSMLKRDASSKRSLKRKRFQALTSQEFREDLLKHCL